MEKIALLGCTGSIGTQVLNVVRRHSDKYKIEALVCNSNTAALLKIKEEFNPIYCGVSNADLSSEFKKVQGGFLDFSSDAQKTAVTLKSVDTVIVASSGLSALSAVTEAIKLKKKILLATKEILVAAGKYLTDLSKKCGVNLIPIDSEHSAIFQCLAGNKKEQLKRIILTASGGPFLNLDISDFKKIKLNDTLNHPKWKMGKKITVDSATMMNKGLEIIEAKWLFDLNLNQIDCIIHPESIIHSMVEFLDSSVICQMSKPNMEIPIQYALSYPNRFITNIESLDFEKIKSLEFYQIDKTKFPCYNLAKQALADNLGLVLNSANEAAVNAYLNSKISFLDIASVVEYSLNKFHNIKTDSLDDIFYYDNAVKESASAYIEKL